MNRVERRRRREALRLVTEVVNRSVAIHGDLERDFDACLRCERGSGGGHTCQQ